MLTKVVRSGRTKRVVWSTTLTALVLGLASPARADEAEARARFHRGIELYDGKHYEQALAEFEAAHREMPSATIKQNIALTLVALNAPAEAATAFDEALEEGRDTLGPETRAAIERELAELSTRVATVNVRAQTPDGRPVVGASLSIAPASGPARELPAAALARPVRLMPGLYTLRARAPGVSSPPDKRLALVTGAPTDVTFVFDTRGGDFVAGEGARGGDVAAGEGALTVVPSVAHATVRVDGTEVARGRWTGPVPAGTHTIEVSAPGWRTTTADVLVDAGANVERSVVLVAMADAPPEYVAPALAPPPKPRRIYLVPSLALTTASYRLSRDLGEPPSGARRGFVGGNIGVAAGYLLTKTFALELDAEIGTLRASYDRVASAGLQSTTQIDHWQVLPVARLVTKGKLRFTAGAGVGLRALATESSLADAGRMLRKTGGGITLAGRLEAGLQADVGPVFLEGALFLAAHGVDAVRADAPPKARLLLASPAFQTGLRLGLGFRL